MDSSRKLLRDLATREVARLLCRAVPRGARVLRGESSVTVTWVAPGDDGPVGRFMRVDGGGMTRIGELSPDGLARAATDAEDHAFVNACRFDAGWLEPLPDDPVPDGAAPDLDRRWALVALAEGAHPATLDVMDRNQLSRDATYRWLRAGGPAALEFADEHPWLAHLAAAVVRDEAMAALPQGPDATAMRVLDVAGIDDPARARALVEGLRHLAVPERQGLAIAFDGVRTAALMPRDLFPPPVPRRSGPSTAGDLDMMAFYSLARWVPALAEASGRDVRSVLGRVDGWAAYLERLGARADCPIHPSMSPDAWPWHVGHDTMDRVADLAAALAEQLLAPAAILAGVHLARRPGEHVPLQAMSRDPLHAAALRLVVGRRTLPAVAEMTRAWHGRADGIMRGIVSLAGGAVPEGPRLFDDLDLGEGLYLASLSTPQELLDEGGSGPDPDGVPGLDHCVGGYAEYVAAGNVAIVSLRRRLPGEGFERLSTAEVAFEDEDHWEVAQHHTRSNGQPSETEARALERGLKRVARQVWERLSAHRESAPETLDWAALVAGAEAWDGVRDLWAFALTRPQRAMGPAELLASAGIPACDRA